QPEIGDEQSIEEYFEALLKRTRRSKQQPPVVIHSPQVPRDDPKSDAVLDDPDSVPVVDLPASGGELQRRAQPVEISDLSAMRELANIQARTALDQHGQRRLLHRAYARIGASAVCFLVTLLALLWTSNVVLRGAGMTILVTGIYLLASGGLAVKQLLQMQSTKKTGLGSSFAQGPADRATGSRLYEQKWPEEADAPDTGGAAAGEL